MRLPVDARFLLVTAGIVTVLVGVSVAANVLAGTAAAGVAVVLLGAAAVWVFDRLDKELTLAVEPDALRSSISRGYGLAAAILILYGSVLPLEVAESLLGPFFLKEPPFGFTGYGCSIWIPALALLILLDWGAAALAGWLTGSLFPARAVSVTGIGVLVLSVARLLKPRAEGYGQQIVGGCEMWPSPMPPGYPMSIVDLLVHNLVVFVVAGVLATRAYVAIVAARTAARRLVRS